MNEEQMHRMHNDKGFIAALDQSGGSTPKALMQYGVSESSYSNDKEMFDLVHEMRKRIIKSAAFNSKYVLGAILFEGTINRTIDGEYTADYLWKSKNIVPFLKIDKGLAEVQNGAQLMKPITNLKDILKEAVEKNIFGTKMRSVIKEASSVGIKMVVEQQFEIARQVFDMGLIPIIEPEVDIHSTDKGESEKLLKLEILKQLSKLNERTKVMLKLSIPTENNFYSDLMKDSHVVRVAALSGGYSQSEANKKLACNYGLIASFSRALLQGLNVKQTDEEFDEVLLNSIKEIYEASIK